MLKSLTNVLTEVILFSSSTNYATTESAYISMFSIQHIIHFLCVYFLLYSVTPLTLAATSISPFLLHYYKTIYILMLCRVD